jgi:ribonuclease E
VIDVNSGSFTRSATARETVLWTNCEAATEIARQLRLRNLAGVIIVDFIDMDSRRDQLQVLEHFNKALRSDKARPQIAQLSELGLVELTRKRQGQNLYELFGQICPTCGGLGHLVRLPGETERPAKEVAEPAIPTMFRESRTPELPEPLDISPVDDADDLDLVNHPNYQERGGPSNNNNRRRRRRRLDEPVPKEELLSKVIPRPMPVLPGKSEAVPESEPLELGERTGKPQLIKSPKEIEPPEVISIEMTPEEQDVYALMGISPLVRLNREVKNPKSVMLSVVLPGESGQTEEEKEAAAESFPEPSNLALASEDAENSEQQMSAYATSSAEDEAQALEQVLVTASAESSTPEIPTDPETPDESGSSRPIVRRRRRRSSAAESDDSTAS